MQQRENATLLYIAVMKPKELSGLIYKVSGKPVGSVRDIKHFAQIAEAVGRKHGNQFYKGLAEIHPDKDFIMDALVPDNEDNLNFAGLAVSQTDGRPKYKNACGCQITSGADGSSTVMPCGDHAFKYATGGTGAKPATEAGGKSDNFSTLALVVITVSVGLLAFGISRAK